MPPATPKTRTLRAAIAESLAIDAATIEAVEALKAAGLRPLLLKGPALARLLYEPGEERSWNDADLLVDPERHDEAMDVLSVIGFRPRISDPLERGSVPHAVHLVRPGRTVGGSSQESIDLHLCFAGVTAAPGVLWASLSEDRDRIQLFGRPIEVPSVSARLTLVALHAASHGRGHPRSLRDIQRAVRRFGEREWAEAAALARAWGALDPFVVGLRLDPVGEGLLPQLGISHDPSPGAVMRGDGMPRAQRGFEQLGRTVGASARLRLVVRKIFPSPELMRIWQPLARRGGGGLLLAYLWRPLWLVWQLPPALVSYLGARRR